MNRDIDCTPCGEAVSEHAAGQCKRPMCPARREARDRESMRFYARLRDAMPVGDTSAPQDAAS